MPSANAGLPVQTGMTFDPYPLLLVRLEGHLYKLNTETSTRPHLALHCALRQ